MNDLTLLFRQQEQSVFVLRYLLSASCILACFTGCSHCEHSAVSEAVPRSAASQAGRPLPVTDSVDAPAVIFAVTEYDFGQIAFGTEKNCSFEFINDGGKEDWPFSD
jgi:hypothetical protein